MKKVKQEGFWTNYWFKIVVWPAVLYFTFFVIYSWPLITHFSSVFFCDNGDGFQNVWNIWWVNKAVTQLHVSPWSTSLLHFPYGVSLLAQTLNPVNGFIAIPLLRFLPLVEVHNIIVIFAFVFGGLSTMWLGYYLSKNYWSSFLAGFFFTFSSYHFAHGFGHLQLVSLEFIPLFILFWWHFLKKPTITQALLAALGLFLVILSDYYYFIYSVVIAVLIAIYLGYIKKEIDPKNKELWKMIGVFLVAVMLTAGRLFFALLSLNKHDALLGAHDPVMFGMDLLGPFVYTDFWNWGSLTRWYWGINGALAGNTIEHTVSLGIAAIVLLFFGLFQWRKISIDTRFWLFVFLFFSMFALGPVLKINGHIFHGFYLPYALLNHFVPAFRISGVPVRMMLASMLAASMVIAILLPYVQKRFRYGTYIVIAFAVIMFIDLFPRAYVQSPNIIPPFVQELKSLPAGAVIDWASGPGDALYYQTIYDKPMAFGYISRTPESVDKKDTDLTIKINDEDFNYVCGQAHLRYLVAPTTKPFLKFTAIYQDDRVYIYDLKEITKNDGC